MNSLAQNADHKPQHPHRANPVGYPCFRPDLPALHPDAFEPPYNHFHLHRSGEAESFTYSNGQYQTIALNRFPHEIHHAFKVLQADADLKCSISTLLLHAAWYGLRELHGHCIINDHNSLWTLFYQKCHDGFISKENGISTSKMLMSYPLSIDYPTEMDTDRVNLYDGEDQYHDFNRLTSYLTKVLQAPEKSRSKMMTLAMIYALSDSASQWQPEAEQHIQRFFGRLRLKHAYLYGVCHTPIQL